MSLKDKEKKKKQAKLFVYRAFIVGIIVVMLALSVLQF